MNKDGSFSKYKEYGEDHLPILEIEFGTHRGKKFLHYHEYIDGIRQEAKSFDNNKTLYEKYKSFFRGI